MIRTLGMHRCGFKVPPLKRESGMRGRILDISTEVESLFLQLGASGRGLHEQLSSIEGMISPPMAKKIRWIASVRNKAVHERVVEVDLEDFSKAGAQVVAYLKQLVASITPKKTKHKDPQGLPEPGKPWAEKDGWEKTKTVGECCVAWQSHFNSWHGAFAATYQLSRRDLQSSCWFCRVPGKEADGHQGNVEDGFSQGHAGTRSLFDREMPSTDPH